MRHSASCYLSKIVVICLHFHVVRKNLTFHIRFYDLPYQTLFRIYKNSSEMMMMTMDKWIGIFSMYSGNLFSDRTKMFECLDLSRLRLFRIYEMSFLRYIVETPNIEGDYESTFKDLVYHQNCILVL